MGRPPGTAAARVVGLVLGALPVLAAGPAATGQGHGNEGHQMSTIELTRVDDGRTVDLRAGDAVLVRLDENPGTGYTWVLEPGGDPVMILESSDYVQSQGSRLGSGGERLLAFEAVRAGAETVRLNLLRAWEGSGPRADTFAVTFRVQP